MRAQAGGGSAVARVAGKARRRDRRWEAAQRPEGGGAAEPAGQHWSLGSPCEGPVIVIVVGAPSDPHRTLGRLSASPCAAALPRVPRLSVKSSFLRPKAPRTAWVPGWPRSRLGRRAVRAPPGGAGGVSPLSARGCWGAWGAGVRGRLEPGAAQAPSASRHRLEKVSGHCGALLSPGSTWDKGTRACTGVGRLPGAGQVVRGRAQHGTPATGSSGRGREAPDVPCSGPLNNGARGTSPTNIHAPGAVRTAAPRRRLTRTPAQVGFSPPLLGPGSSRRSLAGLSSPRARRGDRCPQRPEAGGQEPHSDLPWKLPDSAEMLKLRESSGSVTRLQDVLWTGLRDTASSGRELLPPVA